MKRRSLTEWRPVPGFEGLYEVSKCGLVRSLPGLRQHGGYRPRRIPGRILKGRGKYGNLGLWSAEGVQFEFRTHRLVAMAWVPNPNKLPLVLHWDDDPKNCHADNLRWGTEQDNADDKIRNGNAGKVLTPEQARAIKQKLAQLPKKRGALADLAREFGVTSSMLINIRTGKAWSHA